MRSTGFVILSILVHGIAVAAIAITPVQTVSSSGEKIEVRMGEPADKPGIAEAAPAPEESKPQEIAKPAEVEKPKAVEKLKPAPVKKTVKAQPAETAQPKIVAAAAPSEKSEEAAPLEKDDSSAAAPAVANSDEAPADEEAPKEILMPVKEVPPAGVEAATGEDDTEAKSEDIENSQDPSPVAAATATEIAETGDLAKGGASKEGAISYLDLKQMPGNKAPNYPMQARKEKRQGELELLYRVTKEGRVTDMQVAKSSGFKDLDNEAVRAISQFKFVPGQEGWARHAVSFNLKGAVATLPSQLRGKGAQAD